MSSTATSTGTVTITQNDVIYVGQQILCDLQELSKAYPKKLPGDKVLGLYNSYVTFLLSYAITRLGFSINNPRRRNLVYHEYRYEVDYSGGVPSAVGGRGGQPVTKIRWLPRSATFTSWVLWSDHMKNLSVREQEQIIQGTEWKIPGLNATFNGRYEDGSSYNRGHYQRGPLKVELTEYRRNVRSHSKGMTFEEVQF